MKSLLLVLAMSFSASAMAGPEQCRDLARGEAMYGMRAMISGAEQKIPGYEEYLVCKGKPVTFVSEELVTDKDFGYLYYSYFYTVDCGTKVYKYNPQFLFSRGRCELRGD